MSLTPEARAKWLKKHPLPPGYSMICVDEINAVDAHLQQLGNIRVLLGPRLLAAHGNPVLAVARLVEKAELARQGPVVTVLKIDGEN